MKNFTITIFNIWTYAKFHLENHTFKTEVLTLVIYFNINENEERKIYSPHHKQKENPAGRSQSKKKLNQSSKPSIFQLIFAQEDKKRFRLVFLFPRAFPRQPRPLALIRARCEPPLG